MAICGKIGFRMLQISLHPFQETTQLVTGCLRLDSMQSYLFKMGGFYSQSYSHEKIGAPMVPVERELHPCVPIQSPSIMSSPVEISLVDTCSYAYVNIYIYVCVYVYIYIFTMFTNKYIYKKF